jgi:hypothetical protein
MPRSLHQNSSQKIAKVLDLFSAIQFSNYMKLVSGGLNVPCLVVFLGLFQSTTGTQQILAQCNPPSGAVEANPNTIYYAGGACTFYDSNCNLLLVVPAAEAIWSCSPAKARWALVSPPTGGYYEFPNFTHLTSQLDVQQYMEPFWKCDTIINELILLDGLGSEAHLMYQPVEILSVKNHDYSVQFSEGVDFSIEGRKIIQLSEGPSNDFSALQGNGLNTIQPSSWTNVTYIPSRLDWGGDSILVPKDELLPKLKAKIQDQSPISIQALGMSITAGHHVSGFTGDPAHFSPGTPYMRGYLELLGDQIERSLGTDVSLFNSSCGGKTAAWASEYGEAMVNLNEPDLILIDMGMNDIWGTSSESFHESISSCLNKLRAANPDAEFILVANMLPDIGSIGAPTDGVERMVGFRNKLLELEESGIACLDMTAISDTIYRRKGAKHCTSNALHPNDYLVRWYAQALFNLLDTELPQIQPGTTYYVNSTGTNGDGRTPSTAWTSLDRVNNAILQPGDTVLFEGGSIFVGGIELNHLDANDKAKPVVFSSYGNGKAIIQTPDNHSEGFVARNTAGIQIENLEFRGPNQLNQSGKDGILFFTDKENGYFSTILLNNVQVSGYGNCGIRFYSNYLPSIKSGFSDVQIERCTVNNCRENGIVSIGFDNQNSDYYQHFNFTIKDTRVFDILGYSNPTHKGSGIVLSQIDSVLIEHCEVFNTGNSNTACGGPGGIWVYSANRVVIQYCESHHNSSGQLGGCDGFGFDLDGGVSNSIIQYCYSHDNDGPGFLLGNFWGSRPWLNNQLRYNISVNDAQTNNSAITLFTSSGTIWDGLKFYHNTILASKSELNLTPTSSAFQITDFGDSMLNIECYNNVFQTKGGLPLISIPATFINSQPKFIGNLYWSSGFPFSMYYGQQVNSLAEFRSMGEGCENLSGVESGINGDPLLLGTTTEPPNLYPLPNVDLEFGKLEENSPAIDAGKDLSTILNLQSALTDFWGTTVPVNGNPDIGAFEFNEVSNVSNPKGMSVSALRVVPNPILGSINLHLPFEITSTDSYRIFTSQGMQVLRSTVEDAGGNKLQINVKSLEAGCYFLEYLGVLGTFYCKFISTGF